MSISVTITFPSTGLGSDTGPFNLYSDTDGYTNAFETGITSNTLIYGFSTNNVPNGTTTVRVVSESECCNNSYLIHFPSPTPTQTPTPTPTLVCNFGGNVYYGITPTPTSTITPTPTPTLTPALTVTPTPTLTITPTITPTNTPTPTNLGVNCVNPLKYSESVGSQIFVKVTSTFNVTSDVTVYFNVNTQYNSYPVEMVIPNGASSTTSNRKVPYTSGFFDEKLNSFTITYITPSSDGTYSYQNCI
jgi:hypothetical protein